VPTFAVWIWIDRTYMSGIERGERNVSLVNIERIAKALKMSIWTSKKDWRNFELGFGWTSNVPEDIRLLGPAICSNFGLFLSVRNVRALCNRDSDVSKVQLLGVPVRLDFGRSRMCQTFPV